MIQRLQAAWCGFLWWWALVVRRQDQYMSERWLTEQLDAEDNGAA